ncbi:MAG: HAD family phosphatase [Actinomycetia bacterium]|nr:HAD family phosphatase [Actinomycetes bacterium]
MTTTTTWVTPPLAVLLDYDGTLVDTEPLWIQGEIDLLTGYGVPWTYEQGRLLCGTSREVSMAALLAAMAEHGRDGDVDPDAFYDQLWRTVDVRAHADGLPWLPGAVDLLAGLAEAGVPCALVSASPRPMLDSALASFGRHSISVVIAGGDMPEAKPAPDGYLMAAERLGVDPADCLVIEDTEAGTAAGRAAGAVVVAVPRMRALPPSPGQVNLAGGLAGVTPDRLRELYAQVRAGEAVPR